MGDFYLSTIDQNFILIRPELNLDNLQNGDDFKV